MLRHTRSLYVTKYVIRQISPATSLPVSGASKSRPPIRRLGFERHRSSFADYPFGTAQIVSIAIHEQILKDQPAAQVDQKHHSIVAGITTSSNNNSKPAGLTRVGWVGSSLLDIICTPHSNRQRRLE